MNPIGYFHSSKKYPYDSARQAVDSASYSMGAKPAKDRISLIKGLGFEQALEDLSGFDRIWILYLFHHNNNWKPKVLPPRGPGKKRGVFSTRAPYRPNPIGLSCVTLEEIAGLDVFVGDNDVLDGTPILDIKPYLPYCDSFPNSKTGWAEDLAEERYQLNWSTFAQQQLDWLCEKGIVELRGFVERQLEYNPLDSSRKRVAEGVRSGSNGSGAQCSWVLSYRTWRVQFGCDLLTRNIQIQSLASGYTGAELISSEDVYNDKELHRSFNECWSADH